MTKRKRTILLSAVATLVVFFGASLLVGTPREKSQPETDRIKALATKALTSCLEANDSLLCGIVSFKENGSRKEPETVIVARFDNNPSRIDQVNYDKKRVAIVPGAIMQTATLAWLVDHHGIRPDQMITTNHGLVPGQERDYYILDYEQTSGRDSISVRDGFLMSSRYCTYRLEMDTDLRMGLFWYFDDYFGSSQAQRTPNRYLINDPELLAVADGSGLLLSAEQIVSFYDILANNGLRPRRRYYPRKQVCSEETAATMRRLLRENVLEGTGQRLAHCHVSIAGKTGYGLMDRGYVPGNRYIVPDQPMSASTFAGFFPADAPRYTMMISVIKKDDSIPETVKAMDLYQEIVEQMQKEGLL